MSLAQVPAVQRSSEALMTNWHQWRGPLATGVAPIADPPVEWGETKNVRWKLPLPGKGHSSPIVWNDLVFLMSAEPYGKPTTPVYDNAPGSHDNVGVSQFYNFVVLAVSRKDGKIIWRTKVREEFPHEGGHMTGSLVSNSPTTDGSLLFASFGSRGLYCLDFQGNIKWKKDLGRMQTLHAHGEGSSPVLYKDLLILNWDHEGDSCLYAFDKATGKERWRVARDEKTSWSTPIVVEEQGRQPQIVVSASKRVRGYDLETGTLIWECAGLFGNVVSSPVAGNGMVFAGNSYDGQAMLAIRLEGAKGDITGTRNVVWKLNRSTPYVPSPLLYGETLYFLRHYQNVMSVLDARTGKERFDAVRLGNLRDIFSSPVGAANRIYVTSREGATAVLSHGQEPQILTINRLDDAFSASAAVVGNELFLRGERFLYCISSIKL
ncbi:MAG TPA: PQQ-binding-like beta-propeller repeat protein [Candidatus Saccharimonadales bacterium]|nr:PQQ-binding-like beta-propeller repeat protein [Candidatus Saccharimonadales bacterium]